MAPRFKDARKAIKAFRVASRQDLMGDLRFTQNQLDAIYGNLGTTGAGIGASMTATQRRQLAALTKTVNRGTARAERVVERGQAGAVNRYGTALGGAIGELFRPAAAVARGTGIAATAAGKAGVGLAKSGQLALGIQQSAAAEARAGADYALAVALKSRGQVDAAQAAEMQFQLTQMRLDHRLAISEMRTSAALQWKYRQKEMELAQELETGEKSGLYQGLSASAGVGADSFTGLHSLFNSPMTQQDVATLAQANIPAMQGQPPNATQAAMLYMLTNAIPVESNEALVIMGIARAMWGAGAGSAPGGLGEGDTGLYGVGTSDELRVQLVEDAVVDAIVASYPQFGAQSDRLREAIHAGILANVSREATQFAEGEAARRVDLSSEELAKMVVEGNSVVEATDAFMKSKYGPTLVGVAIGFPFGGPLAAIAGGAIGGAIQGGYEAGEPGGSGNALQGAVSGAVNSALTAATIVYGGKGLTALGKKLLPRVAKVFGLGSTASTAEVAAEVTAVAARAGVSEVQAAQLVTAAMKGGPGSEAWKALETLKRLGDAALGGGIPAPAARAAPSLVARARPLTDIIGRGTRT